MALPLERQCVESRFYRHRPDPETPLPETPLEETLLALDATVRQGKALKRAIIGEERTRRGTASSVIKIRAIRG